MENSVALTFAVTGAAGFVGGRLVRYLTGTGHNVVAVIRNDNCASKLRSQGADVRIADVRDQSQLESAFRGCDGVFHLAALFNDPDKSWEDYRDVNVGGTVNVLAAARHAGSERVVHCSTVGVATEATAPPYSEETPYSPQPDDKYEVTKCEAEKAAIQYANENSMSLSVIRPAQVYGPGDLSKAKFYKLVKKGIIVNPGKTRKHLIFIDDLCRSFLLAMTSPDAGGEIFLIAGARPTPLTRLVRIVADALGVSEPRIRIPAWPVVIACSAVESVSRLFNYRPPVHKRSMDFFTRDIECRTEKARRILGFESRVSVEDGVRMTADWYKAKGVI